MGAILKILGWLLQILAGFFSPEERKKRRKERIWNTIKRLEEEYGKAFADGDPEKAQEIDHEMRSLREKLRLLDAEE